MPETEERREKEEGKGNLVSRMQASMWRDRAMAYVELRETFQNSLSSHDEGASPGTFAPLVVVALQDRNAMAQEAATTVALVFVRVVPLECLSMHAKALTNAAVQWCFSKKRATQSNAEEICLTLLERQASPGDVLRELVQGTKHRSPMISVPSFDALAKAYAQFSSRVHLDEHHALSTSTLRLALEHSSQAVRAAMFRFAGMLAHSAVGERRVRQALGDLRKTQEEKLQQAIAMASKSSEDKENANQAATALNLTPQVVFPELVHLQCYLSRSCRRPLGCRWRRRC